MVHRVNASHIGGCLSIADLLAVLYGSVLRIDPARPDWPERDRFVQSKGHAAAILYAVLAERGFFPVSMLERYCRDGSELYGHVTNPSLPGVEVSTGSLGHGLPIAAGMALAAKREGRAARVFALLSDGELDEGSTWEAVLFAAHHRLDNLVAIVDYNKIQSFGAVADVLDLDPLAEKWRAFRWGVREIDGHDLDAVAAAFAALPFEAGRPSVVVAHTVKGKGVSFMENDLGWHYKAPDAEQLARALAEIGAAA
jgi:transketolase